jgi:hypothetical protein
MQPRALGSGNSQCSVTYELSDKDIIKPRLMRIEVFASDKAAATTQKSRFCFYVLADINLIDRQDQKLKGR